MLIVDGHEDLAWNMLTFGRDYTQSVMETRAREMDTEIPAQNGHTLLGLPEWIRGRVAVIFATLFAAPARRRYGPWDIQCYSDTEEAHRLYMANLDTYKRLVDERSDAFQIISSQADLDLVLASWEGDEPLTPRIGLVLLMEGADGVREPAELAMWFEAGVRICGPAWSGTRYAGGTQEPGPLTDCGRALLDVMADLGMMLDLSHMTDEGVREAVDRFEGPLIASHSNPLARLPHSPIPERHMSDVALRSVAERGGVIGIMLQNEFLKDGWTLSDGREAVAIGDVVAAIDHVCQVVGDAAHVGIGSDFDGGFGLEKVPKDLDTVADLRFIGDALNSRGFTSRDVEAILGGNWLNLLYRVLPES
jgi:membrane dipeptidase